MSWKMGRARCLGASSMHAWEFATALRLERACRHQAGGRLTPTRSSASGALRDGIAAMG